MHTDPNGPARNDQPVLARKLNFILKTCLNVFCYRAIICTQTIHKTVEIKMHQIKEQTELKQFASEKTNMQSFFLLVCRVILWVKAQHFY